MTETAPHGAWRSPITAADVARAGIRPRDVIVAADGAVWWGEQRPGEGGRVAVVRDGADVLPAPWNARTRVHEYGGGAWAPVGDELVFAHFPDQRLYAVRPGEAEPRPLTPEPDRPAALRYADLTPGPDGREVWCVREAHGPDGSVRRALVAVALDGSLAVRELVADAHFLSDPRPSPDGRHLLWLRWDHPRMPWDGTELRVAELAADGRVGPARTVLGGPAESVEQPRWAGPDRLYVVSDRSGWWNLYELGLDGGEPRPLCPREEEFGLPQWQFGTSTFGELGDGRLAVAHGVGAMTLGLLDPATGDLRDLGLPYRAVISLAARGDTVAVVAAGPEQPPSVAAVDARSGAHRVLWSAADLPDRRYLPRPRGETLNGPDGREVHAVVYPPGNPDFAPPDGERPPYVVFVHGGPTAHVLPVLDLEKAYFTSRGIGVVDVNYGGSTGYGREYRERLRGLWGVVDVEDCVAAVQDLARRGEADGARLAIRGGSAGGWTTLAALTRTDAFAAGTSYFGVAELVQFAKDTHDFESRYLDGLVGELPRDLAVYEERAPLSHVDELSCPVLLLQGLEDEVVPPSQAEMFRDALARKGIPHAYLAFEGEQHGFRRAETVVAALEAELSFYGQVFGFDPPDVPALRLSPAPPPLR